MKKILLVEDEQMLAKIMGIKLLEEQFEVVHASDGEEAYKILTQDDQPDLVLLDLLLPKLGGLDLLQKLKDEGRELPKVVVFSNFSQQSDMDRAKELGAVDYIVKAAYSPAEILSKVKAILS